MIQEFNLNRLLYLNVKVKHFRQLNIQNFSFEMTEAMEKCENCLKEFPESKMATHFGYCRRNIKRCAQCGEMYDINCQEEHEEQFHKKTACQFCKKQFGVAEMDKHKNSCSQRTKFCEYCELNVPFNEFPSHLKACESRTKACDKCKKSIANKDYLVHLTTCKGIVQQPRGYDQYLANQRSRDTREEIRQPYQRVEYKVEQKKQPDYRRRQAPTSGGTSNYGIQREKPTVPTPVQVPTQVPSRSQPTTVIPTSVGVTGNNSKGSAYSYQYSGATYNPREGVPTNPVKEQPREQYVIKNPTYVAPTRTQVRTEVRPEVRRNDQNLNNYPSNYRPAEIKRETPATKPTVVPTSNQGYGIKNEPQKPSYMPTTNYPQPRKEPTMKKQEKPHTFDPTEYGGYSEQIPDQFSHNIYSNTRVNDPMEEDEELQKVLIESMSQNNKKVSSTKNIPKDFMNQDLMNSSFCQDFDVQRQRAAYEEMQRNARKNVRR